MQSVSPDLFSYTPPPRYPEYAGFKTSGASEEAAHLVEKTGTKNIWLERCRALFARRSDWTAEEGINFYVLLLKEDPRAVDKNLRPRFTDLTNTTPPFLFKSDERRGDGKVKPHVYRRAT